MGKLEPELLCHPNIPKPLHGVSPRTMLGKDWWDEKRQEAYAERDYHCYACGVHKKDAEHHKWLEAHEDYDINYKTGEVKLKRIVALCHSCHSYIHSGLLNIRLKKGEISPEKHKHILTRGDNILEKADLSPWNPDCGEFAEWGKWHLLIDGKKYYSKFKDFNEWLNHYGRR